MAANVIGCFVIGGLSELAEARALVVIGVLGGFTTFSTFGNETVNLLRDGEWMFAAMNLLTHAVLAIGAVWVGRATAHAIWR